MPSWSVVKGLGSTSFTPSSLARARFSARRICRHQITGVSDGAPNLCRAGSPSARAADVGHVPVHDHQVERGAEQLQHVSAPPLASTTVPTPSLRNPAAQMARA